MVYLYKGVLTFNEEINMKKIQVDIYHYEELKEGAKEKARQWLIEGLDFDFEWNCMTEDAKTVGIELTEWDYKRYCKGELILDFTQVLANILSEHGKSCGTHKTAKKYKAQYNKLKDKENEEDIREDFTSSILEDYRIMLDEQHDGMFEDAYIEETMDANEYTFLKNGTRFQE